MKSVLIRALLLLAVLCPGAAGEVLKITVADTIHPITEEYIERTLEAARRQKAEAVLIELRTPGGLVDSTRGIVNKILASQVPVIIYVSPAGSRAASAGFFILQAADLAAMAPGTNTGAASPVVFGGEKIDETLKAKMTNDAAAFMRSFVAKRGRNVELAESAVLQAKSFTEDEALKNNLIDIVAKDQADLLRQADGRTVKRFDGSSLTLKLAGQPVREVPMTLKQRILSFIMDPNVAFILFSIGMMALYAEFNHPGAILPGTVGVICILLAVFAFNILPVRYAALALIVVAFALFALEAKFASHGVLGAGGVVAMTIGALLLVDAPIPEMRVRLWTALAVSVPIGVITVFLMTLAIRAHRRKSVTGEEGLVGDVGVVRAALAPQGKVFIQGELWDAVAAEPLPAGERVRVRRVNGLLLEVEPAEPKKREAH